MADAFGYMTRTLLIAAACAAFTLFGQRVQAQPPVQEVRFSVFCLQRVSDVSFVPRPNAAPQKLVFQSTARSARSEYRGPMPLRFFDATSGEIVAEANVPVGMTHALLLFTPIDLSKTVAGGLRFQIAVLDDSSARHGPGGLAIINLSGLALSGKVNSESVSLKPGLNPTIAVGSAARVVLTTTLKKRTFQSYARTLALKPNERALLILFPPFYAGGNEVQSRLLVDEPPGTGPAKTRR
jgi:hypothetical protein